MDPFNGDSPEEGGRSVPKSAARLDDREKEILRKVARDSIELGLSEGRPLPVTPGSYPRILEEPGAAFVTLESDGRLRGCVGSLVPRRSLVEDVAENAFAAAFRDSRFSPLEMEEWPGVVFHVSLLTPSEPMLADSREELLRTLRPGVDGLLLEDPPYRATFLPQVWKSLPAAEDFLGELLRKAGLSRDHWSSTLRFHRYEVTEF